MSTFNQIAGFGIGKYLGNVHTHVCWGGGGSSTVENLPDWYKPFIEKGLNTASDSYDAGDFNQVAGLNTQQEEGINATIGAADKAKAQYNVGVDGQDVLKDQALGQGAFSPASTQGLKNSAIADAQKAWAGTGSQLASSGAIGGSRAAILEGDRNSQLANTLAGIDYDAQAADRQSRAAGAQGLLSSSGQLSQQAGDPANYLNQAGDQAQAQTQKELDAKYEGLARYTSILGGTPQPSQSQKQGGK